MLGAAEVTAVLSREGSWYTGELCQAGQSLAFGLIRLRREGVGMVSSFRLPNENTWQEDTVAGRIADPDASHVTSPGEPEGPAVPTTPKFEDVAPWERYEAMLDQVEKCLMDRKDCVVDVAIVEARKGWVVTAYVKPEQLNVREGDLKKIAQQAMLAAADKSEIVYVL